MEEERGVEPVGHEELPAGIPWWCRALVVVPVVVAGLALLGGGWQDPVVVFWLAGGAFWATGALARKVLRQRGHSSFVAQRWVSKGLDRPWLLVPLAAFFAWLLVDSFREAMSPTGDWWSWVVVAVVLGGVAFCLLLAKWALSDWRRSRRPL